MKDTQTSIRVSYYYINRRSSKTEHWLLLTLICFLIISSTSLNILSRSSQQQTHCNMIKILYWLPNEITYYIKKFNTTTNICSWTSRVKNCEKQTTEQWHLNTHITRQDKHLSSFLARGKGTRVISQQETTLLHYNIQRII